MAPLTPSGIVLVEGADASGKTTLVRHLVERHGARSMHGRVWRDMLRWHQGMMQRAVRLEKAGALVVLDRHWISELVYGPIFRGRASYDDFAAALFDSCVDVTVLCVPSDARRHLERFEEMRRTRPEAFDRVEAVAIRYRDLLEGNVAHPGENLVDRFIRFQDFADGRTVVRHDIDDPRCTVERTAREVLRFLRKD